MPQLQLRYSEAYDASISGWTGALDAAYFNDHYDEWLARYLEPAQAYVAQLQAAWNEINDDVFKAFDRFGFHFYELWPAYAVHHWPGVVGFKDPLTFFVGDAIDETIVLLIHELTHCHEDFPANQAVYGRMKDHIFEGFAGEAIAVRYHILTMGVEWGVLRTVFPERWEYYMSLSCQHPVLQRCAEILRENETMMDYGDPVGSLMGL